MGAAAQAIHLNTDNYGPDAFEYNPGRWLKEQNMQDPEELQKFWVPFGIGNRSCIGKNVALMEVRQARSFHKPVADSLLADNLDWNHSIVV